MHDLSATYPVVLTQDVHWGNMDAFEHVNNRVYFRYFEDARMAYFERTGVLEEMKRSGLGPILASTRCDFRAPLSYPDTIQIAASVEDMAPKRFKMTYRVFSKERDALVAEGEGLIVYFNYKAGTSCEIPASVRTAIEALEASTRGD